MTQDKCEVTFKVKVITNLNQHVKIAGNLTQLGFWDASQALQLTTNHDEYPYWSNPVPILLPKKSVFEFKIVVFEHDYLQRWEYLPEGANRKFKVRHHKAQVLIAEGDPLSREIVIEKIEDSFSSLEISHVVKRKNKDKGSFNPFQIAASDDDSYSESIRDIISSSFSSGSDEEFLQQIPIRTSFYHAPAFSDELSMLAPKAIDDSQKIQELYTQMRSQSNNRLWHTSTKFSFHDAFYDVNEEDPTIFEEKEMVYIVTFYLPVKINFSSEGNYEIELNYAHELLGLYEYCRQYHKSRFMWIGLHKQIPSRFREEIEETLSTDYGCHAIYLNDEMYNIFKHKCKNYLWCHLQKIDIMSKFEESEDFWNTYELVSYRVAEKVLSWYERSYVLINDYRFMLVPGLCTKQKPSMKFHYILNFSFPSSHSFTSVPYYLQLINSMLCSAALSFESHDDMCNFVETVREIYGGRLLSQSGYLTLQFFGRFIILNANAHLKREYLRREKKKNYLNIQRQKSTASEFEFNKVIFLSVDTPSIRAGIIQKLKAFEQLLTETSELVGKVSLIQIFKLIPIIDNDEQRSILAQFESRAKELNDKFASKDYVPVQIIRETSENTDWLHEYYAKAHIFIDTNVEKYENPYLNDYIEYTKGKSLIIIQEDLYEHYEDFVFTFTVNPFSVNDITSQMRNCFDIVVNLNDSIASNVYSGKLPLSYIGEWLMKTNTSVLKTNLLMRNAKIFNTYTFSRLNTYENILAACSWNFKKPNFPDIPLKYANCTNRVFIFPIEVFFKNETLEMLKLGASLDSLPEENNQKNDPLETIKRLAANESNVVIIITGKSRYLMDQKIREIKNLHLLGENGYYYRNTNKQGQWSTISNDEISFKEKVRPVMVKYQKKLENCWIQEKDSTIKFKIKGAVHNSITQLLVATLHKEIVAALGENDKAEVFRSEKSIAVRPFGINKGTVIQILLQKTFQEKGKIGFLFCLGKSANDEEMFAGIFRSLKMSQEIFTEVKQIFTCAIGHRPSHANYFINTREEVKKLLGSF